MNAANNLYMVSDLTAIHGRQTLVLPPPFAPAASLPAFGVLGARALEYAFSRVVPLVAGVLVQLVVFCPVDPELAAVGPDPRP